MFDIAKFGAESVLPLDVLKPEQVLYDFDGPRIYTVKSDLGLLLVYVVEDEKDFQVALLTPTAQEVINSLLGGQITVREALQRDWAWLAELSFEGALRRSISVPLPIPDELLPRSGVMLYRKLQPVLSVKLEGAHLRPRNIKASVVRHAIDAGTVSIKRVLDHLWKTKPEGRPSNAIRLLSDLPTQRFVFHSFEVTFGWPAEEAQLTDSNALENDLSQVGIELEKLMLWAQDQAVNANTGGLDLSLLKALERLVPPATGPIERVTLSGAIFAPGVSHIMTRAATKKVRNALKEHEKEQMLISLVGRIGELDKDKLQFTLRDIVSITPPGTVGDEYVCRFANELFDSVFERFTDDNPILVSGRLIGNDVEVSDISVAPEETK